MILLDTCYVLWLASDQSRLSERAKELIRLHRHEMFVSAISAWEIAVKHRKGRLTLPIEPEDWFRRALLTHRLRQVSIDWYIAVHSVGLPAIHEDPSDRFIIATAQLRGWTVVTPDHKFPLYPNLSVAW